MHSIQVFEDVPPIESGDANLMGDTFAPAATSDECAERWRFADLALWPYQMADGMADVSAAHLPSLERHVSELAHSANGHGHLSPTAMLGYGFSHLGLQAPFPADSQSLHRLRYVSPNGNLGGSLSSIDSASEGASSPDAARHSGNPFYTYYDGHDICGSPVLCDDGAGFGHWAPQPLYQHTMVASPAAGANRAACSMKDLLYTRDLDVDVVDDPLDDPDCIKVEPHNLDGLARLSATSTFRDEALGQSIRDDTSSSRDDEDDAYPESGDDSEYNPGLARRRNSGHVKSPARKAPKRKMSKSTTVLGDPKVKKAPPRTDAPRGPGGRAPKGAAPAPKRVFTCSFWHYGCDATFRSKNEWKRHVGSQHLQLGFYRCDTGACHPAADSSAAKTYNDFNRKDLFTQHHRRMHKPWNPSKEPSLKVRDDFEKSLEDVRKRCWHEKRTAPERSTCGFCRRVFQGPNGWEERMEHVGKHFEGKHGAGADVENVQEEEDDDLRDWAVQEGIVKDYGPRGFWLLGLEPAELRAGADRSTRRKGRGPPEVPDDDDDDNDNDNRDGDGGDDDDDDDVDAEGENE